MRLQEKKTSTEWCWQLKQILYGTKRAALLFQEYVIQPMLKIRITAVQVSAQTFFRSSWQMLAMVHGDDFIAAGDTRAAMDQFFLLKKLPCIGPPELGGTSAGKCTRRVVSWGEEGSL